MARTVNVILEVENNSYDLNQMGLIKMEFDRLLSNTRSISTNVLSTLSITMFDKTGTDLLAILQANRSTIKLKYGFYGEMSSVFVLTLIKFNVTYNNLGAMISIGAIGAQINRKFPAEMYAPGTKLQDIAVAIAKRNGWYDGYIELKDMRINQFIGKAENETDFEFLQNKILPLANQYVTDTTSVFNTDFYDFKVSNDTEGRLSLFFREYTARGTQRRVWTYEYGASENNSIISLTNNIDMSFLIQGITVQIPITSIDAYVQKEDEVIDNAKREIELILTDVAKYIDDYNLPYMDPRTFLWNVEATAVEDVGNVEPRDIILNRIREVMNAVSTIKLEVIGNPKIVSGDLIDLVVKNKNGDSNIVSSEASGGSYWRVVQIKESIGTHGFSTQLGLVREVINPAV